MAEAVSDTVEKILEDAGMDVGQDTLDDITNNVISTVGKDATEDAIKDALADSVESVLKTSGDLLSNVTKSTMNDYLKAAAIQLSKDTAEEAAINAGKQVARVGYPASKLALTYGNRILQGMLLGGLSTELIGHWAGFDKPSPDTSGQCTIHASDSNDCNAIGAYLGATSSTFANGGVCRVSGGTVTKDSCRGVRKASFKNGICTVTGSSIIDDRVCLNLQDPCSDDCQPCNNMTRSSCPDGTSCRNRVCEHLRNVAAGDHPRAHPYIQAQYVDGACRLINITEPQCKQLGVIEVENVCQYGTNPKTMVVCNKDTDCTVAPQGKCVPSYTNGNGNPMGGCLPPWGSNCPNIVPPEARYATFIWIVVIVLLVALLLYLKIFSS
jgi:hypothetical protein